MLDHISYSYLHVLACPYAAFLRYEAALRGPTTPHLALGSALHTTLELGHKENDFNLKNWAKIFSAEYNRIILEEDVFVSYPQLKKLENEGLLMLERYIVQVEAGQITKTNLELEKEFRIPIAGTYLVGRIDKIELDEERVIDYKSGGKKPTEWFLRHDLQLTAYYWAYFEEYGKYPKAVAWHHLRTGEVIETERTPDDIEHLKIMINNAVVMNTMGMRHRIFHDRICEWCDYRGAVCDDLELEKKVVESRGDNK